MTTSAESDRRILYVEDDPGLARLLQKSLSRKGYVVDLAADGESGLAQLERQAYALLLIDYNMPDLSGTDVLRRLAEKDGFPPTIMVTGNGDERVAVEAMKLGATDYVIKDAELNYLELLPPILEQVLERQRLIRERETMLATIRENEERYRKLVELSPDGIAVSLGERIEFINPAGALLLGGGDIQSLVGTPIIDIVHPEHRPVFLQQLELITLGRERVPWVEGVFQFAQGQAVDVEYSGIPFTFQGQWAVLVIFRDISERKLAQRYLEHMAHNDALTGLPNRTLFFDRLDQCLLQARRYRQRFALLYIDLDGFKAVNDRLGHREGDALLVKVAQALQKSVRADDAVGRFGGDEFLVLAAVRNPSGARALALHMLEAIRQVSATVGGGVSASIGYALAPADAQHPLKLLQAADDAMYAAKRLGKDRVQHGPARGELRSAATPPA